MIEKLKNKHKNNWFFWLILFLFAGLYLFNIAGWLIHDDEGTDLYEIWQLQLGNQPGVDFIAEQQPLFLLLGKTTLNLFENDILALRTMSALQVLGGAFFLGWVIRKIWGKHVATLSVGVTLSSGIIYEQARLFRPDPMMFGWELFGLGLVLLAVHEGKRPYWGLAGVAYGVAILLKLFGIFPVIGLTLFYLYLLYKQPHQWKQHLLNGLAFAVPFLLVSVGMSLLLYSQLGFYYREVFQQHLSLGQEKSIWDQINITSRVYLLFIVVNAAAIFIVPLAIMNRRSGESVVAQSEKVLLLSQLFVPLFFIFITRPLHARYFIFLLPIFALLLALHMKGFINKIDQNHPKLETFTNLLTLILISFALLATYPSIITRLTRQEDDTIALAQFIQANTEPGDVVVSDYASLNFHAKRPSIYEASIIAGGRIGGGIITGALLIERIEETEAKMVLVHVEGGDPPPHQLIQLQDFPRFQTFLDTEFELATIFNRAEQQIEVYIRK